MLFVPRFLAWRPLRLRLLGLAEASGATNAFVLDAWAVLWCTARNASPAEQSAARLTVKRSLIGLPCPLQRGGRLDRAARDPEGPSYIRSFASVYLLLLRFDESRAIEETRRLVESELPRIEELMVAMPPPDDPGGGTGDGFSAA